MQEPARFDVERFVQNLKAAHSTARSVTHVEYLPSTSPEFGEFGTLLAPSVERALRRRGVERPWSHQAESWEILARGEDLVVVTPTASGKTLCYQAPIVSMLSRESDGAALFLYPTKALAQDQCAAINLLLEAAGEDERAHVYDGDTPNELRKRVRDGSRLVLTNPDMLHSAILPHHEKWRRLFSTLRYVVIDETHMYRGVFGSHFGNVLRRLLRICAHYGVRPQLIFTSATIANPVELAARLSGRRPASVTHSGAPSGEKYFVFYNPPMVNLELQLRQSANSASRRLMESTLKQGASTIAFARSRLGVEVMTRRLRERLEDSGHARLAARVEGYRAGFLPNERRRIEAALRAGDIQGVITTNALELGVDIGALDVCILAGYPGTIASTWQQAGRAGRRQQAALVVLVASDDAVDQYIVNQPQFFIESSPEYALVDPDNLRILAEHLKCAIFELPLGEGESFGDLGVETTQEVAQWLAEDSRLFTQRNGRWYWSSENYPATTVSLRDALDENFVIINTDGGREEIVGEIDFDSAHKTVYEKAIYPHGGALYEVHRLDHADRKAWIRPVNPDYFTTAIEQARVFVLDEFERTYWGETSVAWGEVRLARRFVGYKKIRLKTGENVGYGEILLPDIEKHTSAWWLEIPPSVLDTAALDAVELEAALLGVQSALHTCAVVRVMCDGRDLASVIGSSDGEAWLLQADRELEAALRGDSAADAPSPLVARPASPAIFLYDRYPGGTGLAEKLFGLERQVVQDALGLVERCACNDGCPACIGAASRALAGGVSKGAVRRLLGAILAS